MPVDLEDAEAYELPPLATSSKYPTEEVDNEEAAALLNGHGPDNDLKTHGVEADHSDHAVRREGDDLVGRGSKIEELIAEVSVERLAVPGPVQQQADKWL